MKIAQTTSATASQDIKGLLMLECIEQIEGIWVVGVVGMWFWFENIEFFSIMKFF